MCTLFNDLFNDSELREIYRPAVRRSEHGEGLINLCWMPYTGLTYGFWKTYGTSITVAIDRADPKKVIVLGHSFDGMGRDIAHE